MSKRLVLTLSLCFTYSTFAASHMVVIGGGGEPDRDHTIFDIELDNAANYLRRSNWETRIAFNGGHAKTEKIAEKIASKSKRPNNEFTPEAYEAIISEYERKITAGEIKTGDQLVLMISSHGSQKVANNNTHLISTSTQSKKGLSDYNNLDANTVSLDRLERLTQLAEERGIKLGILDFSCHSGLSQKLANKNTCVISSTGPEHFAWGGTKNTFSATFTSKMRRGKSLEDVFLDAMKDKRETAFPMISSPVGKQLQDTIYPLITPYLHDTRSNITSSKMKQFYQDSYDKDRCEYLADDYRTLIDFTHDIEKISRRANYAKLRDLLAQYYGVQRGIVQNLKFLNTKIDTKTKKDYCDNSSGVRYCMKFTELEILNLDTQAMIALNMRQLNTASSKDKARLQSTVKIYEDVAKAKENLLKDQAIKTAVNFWDKSEHLNNTRKLAENIATETQIAYVNSYQALRKKENNGPCADIKL